MYAVYIIYHLFFNQVNRKWTLLKMLEGAGVQSCLGFNLCSGTVLRFATANIKKNCCLVRSQLAPPFGASMSGLPGKAACKESFA